MEIVSTTNKTLNFQDQECKFIKKDKIREDEVNTIFFNCLINKILKAAPYQNLLECLEKELKYYTSETNYTGSKYLLEDAAKSKHTSHVKKAFTVLKRLGLIYTGERHIHLNPFYRTRKGAKKYEAIIQYYNKLWNLDNTRGIYVRFNKEDYYIKNVEDAKEAVIINYKSKLDSIENNSYMENIEPLIECSLTYEELYDYCFYDKSNPTVEKMCDRDVKALKATLRSTYTNLGFQIKKKIACIHADILSQQLPIVWKGDRYCSVEFYKLPAKFKCLPFQETEAYKTQLIKQEGMLMHPSFEDIQAYLY